MADPNDKKPLPEMRLRQGEMDTLFALFAALQELDAAKSDMRQRLKAIPNGNRDIRLVEVTLTRLLTNLIATVPAEKLQSIRRMLPNMKYKVYFYGSVSQMQDNATAVDANDLNLLCHRVHDYYCYLCDDDCNHCKYGIAKAFDHVLKIDRDGSWSNLRFDDEEGKT